MRKLIFQTLKGRHFLLGGPINIIFNLCLVIKVHFLKYAKSLLLSIQNKVKGLNLYLKASHLVYLVKRWYGSRIYTDCQQNFFSSEHDTGRRTLVVTFLAEQKREYNAMRFDTELVL